MYLRDLNKVEYPVMATHKISDEINGNITLSADIYPNKVNAQFMSGLSEFWEIVTDDEVVYKILYCKTKGKGNKQFKSIKATPKAFDDLDTSRVYARYDGSKAVDELFRIIFQNTNYSYRLLGNWNNIKVEGFGEGDTRLAMFQYVINRIGAEFYFTGNSFTIQDKIGQDTDIMYRYQLNASNIVHEVDGQQYYTFARGYGDYREDNQGWQKAKLVKDYTSPLASIIGTREAPPIKNGNITSSATMDLNLKNLVDNSIKISVTADLIDLRKKNYPYAQSGLGDRVFLIDERIKLNETVRVAKREITKDWRGEIIDINFTFGSQSLVDRYQSKVSNAASAMVDILEGRKKLPFAAMSHEIQIVTGLMLDIQTQFEIAENGSILAIDKSNPNNVVIYNANGLFVSTDGGVTPRSAITARGIMGEAIIAYSVTADKLEVNAITVGFNNYSTNIKLFHDRIDMMSSGVLRARLTHKTLQFYNQSQVEIGKIDAVGGGVLLSANSKGYVGLGHDLRDENGLGMYMYHIIVDPNHIKGKYDIQLWGSVQVGGFYDLDDSLKVGYQFKGKNLAIPEKINPDGTIASWFNFSF